MPEYTYTFIDIRSQAKLGSLPLYGVNCSDLLLQGQGGAGAGTFTGSIRMDADFVSSAQEILDITSPLSTMVWMERDNSPIWCGILWTRTYQSDGRVLQLNAQTFSSYLSKVVWLPANPAIVEYSISDNPHNIIRYCWQYLITVADDQYDVGVKLEDYHVEGDAISTPNQFMTTLFDRGSRKTLSEYVGDALKLGAEYRIVPTLVDGQRVPVFQAGLPNSLGVTQNSADQGAPYQYPGDIGKYWLTNSNANAPTRLIGVGKSSGQDDIVSVQDLSTTGRIGVDAVQSYDTDDNVQLARLTSSDVINMQNELNRPVYELNGGNVDLSWGLGDYRRIVIDDPYRFNTPVGGNVRLVGWSLSPSDSSNIEQMSITIDNVSNLVALNV